MVKFWLFVFELLKWLRTTAPQLFNVGIVIYDKMAERIKDLEVENQQLKFQIKLLENKNEVENAGKTKSDSDVLDDILNSPDSTDGSGTKS